MVYQCATKRNMAKRKRGSLFSQIIVFITLACRKTELLTIRHRRSFKKSLRQKLNSIFKALYNSSLNSLCFVFSSTSFLFSAQDCRLSCNSIFVDIHFCPSVIQILKSVLTVNFVDDAQGRIEHSLWFYSFLSAVLTAVKPSSRTYTESRYVH